MKSDRVADLRSTIKAGLNSGAYSQTELASAATITTSHLSHFLRDEKRGLRTENLEKLELAAVRLRGRSNRSSSRNVLEKYRRHLRSFVAEMDLRWAVRGPTDKEVGKLSVSDVFVPPKCKEIGGKPWTFTYETLFQRPVCHLFGPAGSGKTMVVRHLIEVLTRGKLEKIPMFLPLNALNQLPSTRTTHLRQLVKKWNLECGFSEVDADTLDEIFIDALERGKAVVLLDGLDELRLDRQKNLTAMINRFISKWSRGGLANRFLITERGSAPFTRYTSLHQEKRVVIEPFKFKQKKRLVKLWQQYFGDKSRKFAIKSLLRNLESDDDVKSLAKSPLFLTLLIVDTVCGRVDSLKPTKVRALETFIDGVLGHWDNVRSLDGLPTPRLDDFDPRITTALLSHLAWRMIGENNPGVRKLEEYQINASSLAYDRAIECIVHHQKRYLSNDDDQTQLVRKCEAFFEYCKGTGLLVCPPTGEQFLGFGPHPQIVRDWFLVRSFRFDRAQLSHCIKFFVKTPSPGWQPPLTLAISAMASLDKNIDFVIESVDQLLDLRPLQGHDSIDADCLNRILPLGLEVCLEALEIDRYAPAIEQMVLSQLQDFYEDSNYAVVIDHLHSWMVRFARRRAHWGEDVPDNLDAMNQWVCDHQHLPNNEWLKKINRIWRYQHQVSCVEAIINELIKRMNSVDLKSPDGDAFSIALRRCIFSLRFDMMKPKKSAISLLKRLSGLNVAGPEILQMMAVCLAELSTVEQPAPRYRDDGQLIYSNAENFDDFVQLTIKQTWQQILNNGGTWLEAFLDRKNEPAESILHRLAEILTKKTSAKSNMSEQRKTKAIAAILLARFFELEICESKWTDVLPGARFSFVLESLLIAANDLEQRTSGDAYVCQVYDVAAWAIRAILSGQSSDHLKGLPLFLPVIDEVNESATIHQSTEIRQ